MKKHMKKLYWDGLLKPSEKHPRCDPPKPSGGKIKNPKKSVSSSGPQVRQVGQHQLALPETGTGASGATLVVAAGAPDAFYAQSRTPQPAA